MARGHGSFAVIAVARSRSPRDGSRRTGRPDARAPILVVLAGAVAIATFAGVVGATTIVIGFETFDNGTELANQLEEGPGVRFQPQPGQTAGAIVVRCSPNNIDCPEAESGRNAIVTPLSGEGVRAPLEIRFAELHDDVRIYVRETAGEEARQYARLEARDASGTVVEERTIEFMPDSGWHRIRVRTESPRIKAVTLTLTDEIELQEGVGPRNQFVADELVAVRPDPPAPGVDPWVAGGLVIGGLIALWLAWKGVSRLRGDGDGDGEEDANRPPYPKLTPRPAEPEAGRPVAFDGTSSFDPDPEDAVAGYEWTIEGDPEAGQRVVHTFDEAGEYDVTLTVSDRHGATETTTETITVEEGEGELDLARAHPNAPGDDHENLDRELLVFENVGDGTLDLSGWTVHDAAEAEDRVTEGEHTFEFPDGFELDPDATVAVHTGPEPADAAGSTEPAADRRCYWGRDWAVWNNEADVIVVENGEGDPVLGVRYERTDEGEYELEDLEPASLGDWFSAVEAEPDASPSIQRPGVPIDVESDLPARIRDFVAGLGFQRGPRGVIVGWMPVAAAGFLLRSDLVFWGSVLVAGLGVAWAVLRRVRA